MGQDKGNENDAFNYCWKTSKNAMYKYVQEVRKKQSHLFPRQQFVREQGGLFVQDCLAKMEKNYFTAARFREGLENLYYLAETVRELDDLSLKTVCRDIQKIITMMGVLVEYYEESEGFKPTCWYSVLELFKNQARGDEVCPPLGKFKYFSLGNMLGAGGFGAVYKAWFGNVLCTLKFVPPHMLPSMKHALADKQVACMINHPCLVKYYATFMTSGAFVTCMEYIPGADLTKVVRASGYGLPTDVVRMVIAQLGLAIQHLHFKGFIHRDIKPDNIMILSGCRIKLIDFDTCKVSIGKYSTKYMPTFHEKTCKEFSSQELAGTLPYMPPEAFRMSGLGRALDWWATGVVTYELATGKLPFRGYNEQQLRRQVTKACYTWPYTKKWDANMMQFVSDCLNVDSNTRLCSRKYSDFQNHAYFSSLDFHWLESEPSLIDYPLIDDIVSRIPAHFIDDPRQMAHSAGAEQRRARLFPNMRFKDMGQQPYMYCYSSPGFIRCMEAWSNGKNPEQADIQDEHEFLNVEDDYSAPYVFVNFAKDSTASTLASAYITEDTKDYSKITKLEKPKKQPDGGLINMARFMSFMRPSQAPPKTTLGTLRRSGRDGSSVDTKVKEFKDSNVGSGAIKNSRSDKDSRSGSSKDSKNKTSMKDGTLTKTRDY